MFTGEADFVVDQEKESREKIYRQQEALQEPGAINKFLEEITDLSSKVASVNLEDFELIKLRAKEIVDINVGVVENPDVYLQNKVDNEISRLKDEIFKRDHPKIYALAKEALLKDLPKGIDIYNGSEVRNKLILTSVDNLANFIRGGMGRRWQMVAGVKPIRSSVFDALKEMRPGVNEFEEFENKLIIFEKDIETNIEEQEVLKKLIFERHDRVRCRIYTNSKFNLNYLMAKIRYRDIDVIKKFLGKSPEWNYYISKWLYKSNGSVDRKEIEDKEEPASTPGFFLGVAQDLKPDDLVYAAWHTRLGFRRIFGPKIPTEVQVLPIEFEKMNGALQNVFKMDKPDINVVSPELRKKVNMKAKKFLWSE